MSLVITGSHLSASGVPFETARRTGAAADELVIGVGNWKASKSVKQDAAPREPGGPLRWRSLQGETFEDIDAVAESMRWAVDAAELEAVTEGKD